MLVLLVGLVLGDSSKYGVKSTHHLASSPSPTITVDHSATQVAVVLTVFPVSDL